MAKPISRLKLEPQCTMKTYLSAANSPAHFGFLLDELRLAGVTTYADLATTFNRQGLRPPRGRWTAHALHLVMRQHRCAHPAALIGLVADLEPRRGPRPSPSNPSLCEADRHPSAR